MMCDSVDIVTSVEKSLYVTSTGKAFHLAQPKKFLS